MTWWNDYVGLPYRPQGRTRAEGLDCWGLVRLAYAEQFQIPLPSYVESYRPEEYGEIADAIAANREAWTPVDVPTPGDVVLFRIFGQTSHVGLAAAPGTFLHAREGFETTIERLDASAWRHRIEGYFRHADRAQGLITLSACPHPLRTQRIDAVMPDTMTLRQIVDAIATPLDTNGVLILDGQLVPREDWANITPHAGSRIEYRALAGSDIFKAIFSIAIIAFAIWAGGWLGAAYGLSTFTTALATGAIAMTGNLLLNAIFPTRPPDMSASAPGKRMAMLTGGQNQASLYGAIPVVLGKHRFAALYGAQPLVETSGSDSHLRMILTWGYGPLQVSDIRVGDTPIQSLEDVEIETLQGTASEDQTRFRGLYPSDTTQTVLNLLLPGSEDGSTWQSHVIGTPVTRVGVAIHFPEGLRGIRSEGEKAGQVVGNWFTGDVQIRELDPNTLAPTGSWGSVQETFRGAVSNLSSAYFNIDNDAALEEVYRWTTFSINSAGALIAREGLYSESPTAAPSSALLTRQNASLFNAQAAWKAVVPATEVGLWRICVKGGAVYSTEDLRGAGVSGCGLTTSGLKATIASGTITWDTADTIKIGGASQEYNKRRDAFTLNFNFPVPSGCYEVRVRRTSDGTRERDGIIYYGTAYLLTVTGYTNNKPVTPPAPLAMSALRVKATNQTNGSVAGITAICQSICKDWDTTTSAWVTRATRNPASLFRYVLQHPANAQAVSDSEIDLSTLASWHSYCRTNQFMYDGVVTDQRSILDVLRDICAAGRASPSMRDGQWSVVIDKARTTVAQHFTPHNSWGFESVKALPVMPHGFRVQFANSEKDYQPDERIVYADGYTSSNATLLEGLALPGVTTAAAIHKHGRFHLAQLKLRPETYTLNADMEHLVCQRGDLVRVSHDVPMWGLGTGRVAAASGTAVTLDEAVPMVAGTQYTIRFRLQSGATEVRTVASKPADGNYTTITLTSSTTAQAGDLFMFGATSSESVECIVIAVEPTQNMTARLTLVDYSPAVYDSDSETLPAFNSQITRPPVLARQTITDTPTISAIVSDETAMTRPAPGQFVVGLQVAWSVGAALPTDIRGVEAQLAGATGSQAQWRSQMVPLDRRSCAFDDVTEGEQYQVRLRYYSAAGQVGPWTAVQAHVVVGKSRPPAAVSGFSAVEAGADARLSWADNVEPDVVAYEIRTADSGWGTAGYVFRGAGSSLTTPAAPGQWYIRAIDAGGLYSTTSSTAFIASLVVPDIAAISETFADTSTTSATVTLSWDPVAAPFGVDYYVASYDAVSVQTRSTQITFPANWLGARVFTVVTVDQRGVQSAGLSKSITKLAPNSPTNVRAQVIDNTVLLYWTLPARTTLPIDSVKIKRGATWAGGTVIGTKSGEFTTILETAGGAYTYWLACIDTDGNESAPVSVPATVSAPPDFVFAGAFTSTFGGTKSSAIVEAGAVLLPVDTSETWSSHFTTRSWNTPDDQIAAGYPVFIQPTAASGYYEETFDFGATISSSKVTVGLVGETLAGTPSTAVRISLSTNGSTYTDYDNVTEVFGSSFRYVKVRVTISQSGSTALYRINSLAVRAEAKLRSDSGTVSCVSSDASGTVANFFTEFLDISSITLTPSGTAAAFAVYDFNDSTITGTYSVTSNVVTVTATAHGLVAGQKVRLTFTTGTAPSGIYAVASVTNSNTYTVSLTTANTSGNVSTYPAGFRAYLFNSSGTRITGTVSWSARGY